MNTKPVVVVVGNGAFAASVAEATLRSTIFPCSHFSSTELARDELMDRLSPTLLVPVGLLGSSLLLDLQSWLRGTGIPLLPVERHRRYLQIGPLLGQTAHMCADCLDRRLLASPPDGMAEELVLKLRYFQRRNQLAAGDGYTTALSELVAAAIGLTLRDPVRYRSCAEVFDVFGGHRARAQITPLHGCATCFARSDPSARFTERLRPLVAEAVK